LREATIGGWALANTCIQHWPIDRLPSLKQICRRQGALRRNPDRRSQQPVPNYRVSPQGCSSLL
jgi:hypothetical protein